MITILKRTRVEVVPATDPITYENWSEWESTDDSQPYTNSETVQYKTSTEYKIETFLVFNELMSSAIGEDTPFRETLSFLQTELDDDNLTPKEKATLKAQVMANVTSSITNNAMQLAPTIANKELRIIDELAMLSNQRDVSDETKIFKIEQAEHQSENSKQNALFVKEKITQLAKAAKDNNKIQAGKILEELFGQHSIANGGTITQDMFELIFEMVLNMYNNTDASIVTPANNITTA